MPTRKISDDASAWVKPPCPDREHNPPTMRVFEPGLYEHTCPTCGKTQKFRIWHYGRMTA